MTARILGGIALTLAIVAAPVAAATMQPGLWEVMTRGDGAASPVTRVCFTDKDVASAKRLPVPSAACQAVKPTTANDKTSYDIVCTGTSPMHGHAELSTTASAYEGDMKVALRLTPDKPETSMHFTFAGRRVGDCAAAAK